MSLPQNMSQLIHYQAGSVVSKEIINKPTGTITLFAFEKGQGLSEHTTPFDALVVIVEGKAEIVLSGKTHTVQTGELLLMPANEPHALKAVEPFKMLLTMIKS